MIFISGIHGVGKTYLCRQLSNELNFPYYSASELINRFKKDVDIRNKEVENIKSNQDLFLKSLSKYTPKNKQFLLDGHFTLLTKENKISQIPKGTFSEMNIDLAVVIKDSPISIIKRLKERDGKQYENHLISYFQNQEEAYAQEISTSLDIPYFLYDKSYMDSNILYEKIKQSVGVFT